MAGLRVEVEHFELLEKEWKRHPLLDFILWQEAQVGYVMAITLPQDAMAGHNMLAQLLKPACTADVILEDLDQITRRAELAGWTADEFRHGVQHMRAAEYARALTPLTVGLEGLIRTSAVSRGFLSPPEVESLTSGAQLVKKLWGRTGSYEPYMKSWVFGMANVYRHGGDRGAAAEQALHVVCGAAIWAKHVMQISSVYENVQQGLAYEVRRQYREGTLQVQPDATRRLERAAAAAQQTDYVRNLMQLRQQLLETRDPHHRSSVAVHDAQRQVEAKASASEPADP
jgi:hypothetical protein